MIRNLGYSNLSFIKKKKKILFKDISIFNEQVKPYVDDSVNQLVKEFVIDFNDIHNNFNDIHNNFNDIHNNFNDMHNIFNDIQNDF